MPPIHHEATSSLFKEITVLRDLSFLGPMIFCQMNNLLLNHLLPCKEAGDLVKNNYFYSLIFQLWEIFLHINMGLQG